MYFRVPSVYDNATPSGSTDLNDYLMCSRTIKQEGTAPITLACGDDIIAYSGFTITRGGSINLDDAQVLVDGVAATGVSATTNTGAAKFDEVATDTARTIKVTFNIPSGYANTGTLTCDVSEGITQPQSDNPCIVEGTEYYIAQQGFGSRFGYCDNGGVYSVTRAVSGTIAVGETVCIGGEPYNGFGLYWAVNENPTPEGAGATGAFFSVIRIDNDGQITEKHDNLICESEFDFDQAL